MIWKRL